ncbi:MAG: hypothetical protein ACRYGL_01990 [Janthinobacterium lividum]
MAYRSCTGVSIGAVGGKAGFAARHDGDVFFLAGSFHQSNRTCGAVLGAKRRIAPYVIVPEVATGTVTATKSTFQTQTT